MKCTFFKVSVITVLMTLLISAPCCFAGKARPLLSKGWEALVRDEDTLALQLFGMAYLEAVKEQNTKDKADALLHMGLCCYSISYSEGMSYAIKAMEEYKKLEKKAPEQAMEGRSRCLQLISTIEGRMGNYRTSVTLSREALTGFSRENDTTGYLGLIYNSLGSAYQQLNIPDSSVYFHHLALTEHLRSGNLTYLPTAYIQVARIEAENYNRHGSLQLFRNALRIADTTGNRQAQVSALLEIGNWHWTFDKNIAEARHYYLQAAQTAATISDPAFRLKVLEYQQRLYKATGDYKQALAGHESIVRLKDSIYSWDRQMKMRSQEILFEIAEKDRQLQLARKEKEVVSLTNYLLWAGLGSLLLLSGSAIFLMRRSNKRDKLLLQTKEALVVATQEQKRLAEEQKVIKEKQMQQELEFKESQLSAMTLQMLQKNEVMQELRERLEADNLLMQDQRLNKLLNKGLNQDKDWSDFNTYFESINQHFYTRLKQSYPDISPNDLKICALIKLHLSTKEMASILNISPDSVKTARYRLRKKLQLNTEDNLTDFIMAL